MRLRILIVVLFAGGSLLHAEPLYREDFQKASVGGMPAGLLVLSGAFAVVKEQENSFLELPGSPLETFGVLFGPNALPLAATVRAKISGTKEGRKFPSFGVSLGGAGGYRLQMSAAKRTLEIFKDKEPVASVPRVWKEGWTHLRLQMSKGPDGKWIIAGKAWEEGSEPAEWAVQFTAPQPPSPGRAAAWGAPYSGTPIRFDDFEIAVPGP